MNTHVIISIGWLGLAIFYAFFDDSPDQATRLFGSLTLSAVWAATA